MNIEFDMYQTLALAVLVLLLGSFLKKHIHFKTPHWVSGKILYSGTCYRWFVVCHLNLHRLLDRTC